MSKQQDLFLNKAASLVKEFAKVKSEHDLRLKVSDAFFDDYSVNVEDERVDFLVYHPKSEFFTETFMWAESKDKPTDVFEMFAQLLLTIKKKVDSGEMPPKYLGVFDKEKIAFTEYHNALDIFHLNDFNWTERPSAVSKKTVNQVAKYLKNIVEYRFDSNLAEIVGFIRTNFALGKIGTTKAQINKNNFVTIYNKWVREVLPTIGLSNGLWKSLKESGVGDCDFYLADLLSRDNKTIVEKLNIVLRETHYKSKVIIEGDLGNLFRDIEFNDGGEAHAKFWARYERPPKQEYHKHIIERRELLVPQEIRERKGAYFTPQIWVEKSQEYLAQVFGENWQEEYYIWDCCAGTCNLLVGLTHKYNIWASTIDQPDVDIVHEIIDRHGLNLLKSHVFRFDFLNDEFIKLPAELRDIINDPEKRKRLIIYMNPPYAEATSTATATGKRRNKEKVAIVHKTRDKFKADIGSATNEIFAQFMARIYHEIPHCKLALFSKLKFVNSQNFIKFREFFKAEFKNGFMVRANTFDNVDGQFPIGFTIWDLDGKSFPKTLGLDVAEKGGRKRFWAVTGKSINRWIIQYNSSVDQGIAYMANPAPDFQRINQPYLDLEKGKRHFHYYAFDNTNIIVGCIYFAVRLCIQPTWVNDRDQFLFPNDGYITDKEFQNDCLVFTLFHHQNRICSKNGINHWIPFTAREVDAMDNFRSTFMSDFLKKRKKMSKEAKAVFEAGKALWQYYHKTIQTARKPLVDASFYEIREYFKGRDKETGRMKAKATDERFNELDSALREALKKLAVKIEPKVYEYGFLKK